MQRPSLRGRIHAKVLEKGLGASFSVMGLPSTKKTSVGSKQKTMCLNSHTPTSTKNVHSACT